MSGNLIDYRVENGVAILALNDPPANTYTYTAVSYSAATTWFVILYCEGW